ncbi:MAG: DUF3052 domain-containing protein [Acidimicrobiales bacterium]
MPAGYSGTPLAKKLGIKEGCDLALLNAPAEMTDWLALIPDDVAIRGDVRARADVVVGFFDREAALRRRLPALLKAIFPDGGVWVAWPKKASGVPTDITEDTVRGLGRAAGVVDNKVCAISEVWSGLRLVHRVENRR